MGTGFREFSQTLRCRVSPYLRFIPSFKYFVIFELNEAVRGCLIRPKPWDRIDMNF